MLTAKQSLFVKEYLKDRNATQAAIRAGFTGAHVEKYAWELMQNKEIAFLIEKELGELKARAKKKAQVSEERWLKEVARIAFFDPADVAEWSSRTVELKDSSDVPAGARRLISEISSTSTQFGKNVKVKFHSKIQALGMIQDYLGLSKKKLELSPGENQSATERELSDDERRKKLKEVLTALDILNDEDKSGA